MSTDTVFTEFNGVNILAGDVSYIGQAPVLEENKTRWGTRIVLSPDTKAANLIGLTTIFSGESFETMNHKLAEALELNVE